MILRYLNTGCWKVDLISKTDCIHCWVMKELLVLASWSQRISS